MVVEINKEQLALLGIREQHAFTYIHSEPSINKAQGYIIHHPGPSPPGIGLITVMTMVSSMQ